MSAKFKARLLIQQCLSASLKHESHFNKEEVKIGRGCVVYVCFKEDANQDTVLKIVEAVMGLRLSPNDQGQILTIADLPGDILIVPQATLGGKLKGKSLQYHGNMGKEPGLTLYTELQRALHNRFDAEVPDRKLLAGCYGATQMLAMVTNGPSSHVVDL